MGAIAERSISNESSQRESSFNHRAELVGFFDTLKTEPLAIFGRIHGLVRNIKSADNEDKNPDSAYCQGRYSLGTDRHGEPALISSEIGAVRIRGQLFHGSHTMVDSMVRHAALILKDLQAGRRPVVSLRTAIEQIRQFRAFQTEALSLEIGQSLLGYALCGSRVDDGVALFKITRVGKKDFVYESRLVGGLTEGAAKDLLERFSTQGKNQMIFLDEKKKDAAYLAVKGIIDEDLSDKEAISQALNEIFRLRGEKPPETLRLSACSSTCSPQRGLLENPRAASEQTTSSPPDSIRSTTVARIETSEEQVSSAPVPMFRNNRTNANPQALRNRNPEDGGSSSNPPSSPSSPFFPPTPESTLSPFVLMFQNIYTRAAGSKEVGQGDLVFEQNWRIQESPVVANSPQSEPVSMFQTCLPAGRSLKKIVELPTSQPEIPAGQTLAAKHPQGLTLRVDLQNSNDIRVEQRNHWGVVRQEVEAVEEIPVDEETEETVVTVPLIEIPGKTTPMIYIIGVEEKPVEPVNYQPWSQNLALIIKEFTQKSAVAKDFVVYPSNVTSIPKEENYVIQATTVGQIAEVSQNGKIEGVVNPQILPQPGAKEAGNNEGKTEDTKVLVVKKLTVQRFPADTSLPSDTTVLHRTVVKPTSENKRQSLKTEKLEIEKLEIRKLVWVVNSPNHNRQPTILELELPKDQNQRLYAFLHFLRKLVKQVFGEDVLWTRLMKVIRADEPIEVDNPLESLKEIEYYLELLKGNHAQVFAFAN